MTRGGDQTLNDSAPTPVALWFPSFLPLSMSHLHSAFLLGERLLVVQCADVLRSRNFRISGIASSNPHVLRWANENGIRSVDPVTHPDALRNCVDAAIDAEGPIDFLLSITYLRMIPEEVIAKANRMAVNFHDSLLPRYAGLNATTWAIAAEESTHGISWHRLTNQPDTGELLLQVPIAVSNDETALTLNTKCFEAATDSFEPLIEKLLADKVLLKPQDFSQRSYFSRTRRFRAAGWVDVTQPAKACSALVRSLDFGDRFENPLSLPKIKCNDQWWITRSAVETQTPSSALPGTILSIEEDSILVATSTNNLQLGNLCDFRGDVLSGLRLARAFPLNAKLQTLSIEEINEIDKASRSFSKHHDFWVSKLAKFRPLSIPISESSEQASASQRDFASQGCELDEVQIPHGFNPLRIVSAFALFLSRISGQVQFDLEFRDDVRLKQFRSAIDLIANHVPLSIHVEPAETIAQHETRVHSEWERIERHGFFSIDKPLRYPQINQLILDQSVSIKLVDTIENTPDFQSPIALIVQTDGARAAIRFRSSLDDSWRRWLGHFNRFLTNYSDSREQVAGAVQYTSAEERAKLLSDWNSTSRDFPRESTVDREFAKQVAKTPDAVAVISGEIQWTYHELDSQANRIASEIVARGFGRGDLIGIATSRNASMVAAILAVLKIGAAYVPLDLEFPKNRISLMIDDAKLRCILVDRYSRDRLPSRTPEILDIEVAVNRSGANASADHASTDLAYVIYTSGSTGVPKGVMVNHRNVLNFFAGMDNVIPHDPPSTFLAVTSLSFDISVLELLWTLARGFKVVLHDTPSRMASAAKRKAEVHQLQFGLFYFSSSAQETEDPYRLLLEGAKFADERGFNSVWTPERHFHDFGGLYPNSAVTSAAVAAITQTIKIRSGSVVLPLHHPARVAEEWSVVDRLSGGRVGLSFASGWQPNDFIFQPQNYHDAKKVMFENLEIVRKLWRGENVEFPGHDGASVSVQTFPRPIQNELPVWITTAGNEATFRQAGLVGANILTHLLGQTIEELTARIKVYREARSEAGHAGLGEVSVMVHTFIGDDTEKVRELVREPLIEYLRTSASLLRGFSHTWAAFKKRSDGTTLQDFNLDAMSDQEMEDLLAFSFERYFETSGLFGTPDRCLELVRKLRDAGTTEIACLIDFGVPANTALAHLEHLDRLRRLAIEEFTNSMEATVSIGDLVKKHDVTHFQCTPSMAQMLWEDEESRAAIQSIPNVLLGGEALPPTLSKQIMERSSTRLLNVYGPTETTVWSTSKLVDPSEPASNSIGYPIANTSIYILDSQKQPVPVGVIGELWIGGEGVVPGYFGKEDLTSEKFCEDPFSPTSGARMYLTGDLARWNSAGEIEFFGRADGQVKIRGHRIELGEIENAINQHMAVRQSVVVADKTAGAVDELIAYLVTNGLVTEASMESQLRSQLRSVLPSHMIPARFVILSELPLTPNGKIDRRALPRIDRSNATDQMAHSRMSGKIESETQAKIETIWRETLKLDSIQMDDNFFDLGGHSLLAVRAHKLLKDRLLPSIAITDLFRFPTIRTLSQHIDSFVLSKPVSQTLPSSDISSGQSRASKRKEMLARRRGESSQ